MPKRKRPAYDDTLRFRAFKKLRARLERIVAARGYGDSSDLMREATTLLVEKEEIRLHLPPMSKEDSKKAKRT
ncbi:MAG TPA: hypothetical protein VGI59_09555 [Candidatus Udaeobacter sp.]|jgi:Arc/MetJ-type ribon-helix-helix transcriptional regulator